MSIISISDPEIFYDTSTKTDEVVRHVLFSHDSEEERCTGDARPILEMYPASYVEGTYSGATYGRQSADELKVRINLPQYVIDDIIHAMGRNNSLNDMITKVYIDKRFTPWNTKPFNQKSELAAEDTIGSGIRINGNLKVYLQYTGCSRHNKLSCYAQSHGKKWELRGRLLSGSIELGFH